MTTRTEGQHKGEFITSLFQGANAQNGGDISVENVTFDNGHGVVADGTVMKYVGGKVVPATGSVDTGGDSDEDIAGIAFGSYDTTNAEIPGVIVARLAVVDDRLLTGATTAVKAALAANLFIIARH